MLNELLVLGQIPGTNFQITFSELLILFAIIAAAAGGFIFYKKRLFGRYVRRYGVMLWLFVQPYLESKKNRQLSLPL